MCEELAADKAREMAQGDGLVRRWGDLETVTSAGFAADGTGKKISTYCVLFFLTPKILCGIQGETTERALGTWSDSDRLLPMPSGFSSVVPRRAWCFFPPSTVSHRPTFLSLLQRSGRLMALDSEWISKCACPWTLDRRNPFGCCGARNGCLGSGRARSKKIPPLGTGAKVEEVEGVLFPN
jgi:hypothetical protein